jgi:hypothetical protein
MRGRGVLPSALALVIAVGAALASVEAQGPPPKRGGVLTSVINEDPRGFSIHESATDSHKRGRMQDVWLDT